MIGLKGLKLAGSKGQAFDVFKLLIAAIIAIAMLSILMPILQSIGLFGISDPNQAAADLVKKQYGSPSAYGESSAVTFTKEASQLNAKAIAQKAQQGLDVKNICISPGDFSDDEFSFNESTTNNVILDYTGSQKRVKLGAICDDGRSLTEDLGTIQGLDNITPTCAGGSSFEGSSQTYCVVIVRAT